MKKQIVTFALCCFMFIACGTQVLAAEVNTAPVSVGTFTITPRMNYIVQANGSLYIDSKGVATVKCAVYANDSLTTRVKISANLQQYKSGRWVTLKTFTAESDSHRTSLSESYSISKGYSYRVQASIKAYSGPASETQTVTSSEAEY